MILIGSKALEYYIPINRRCHDIDFIMTEEEASSFHDKYKKWFVKETDYSSIYDIDGDIVEVRNSKNLDPSDVELFYMPGAMKDTPYGKCLIPSLQTLYDIKVSTQLCSSELKHKYDVALFERHFPNLVKDTEFFRKRLAETQARQAKVKKVKYEFFHKYHIPEYLDHDSLHVIIADLLDINIPTYQRVTCADVAISKDNFDKLTHAQKVSLMVEESLVLALERWLIPQNVENGISYRIIENFYNNNEAMPTYLILKQVCLKGLKTEASWVVETARENFFEIEKEWVKAKQKIKDKGGFPQWMFEEIFQLRERYKNKEQVALL